MWESGYSLPACILAAGLVLDGFINYAEYRTDDTRLMSLFDNSICWCSKLVCLVRLSVLDTKSTDYQSTSKSKGSGNRPCLQNSQVTSVLQHHASVLQSLLHTHSW